MDEEKPVAHYESKVAVMADKWFDAKFAKVGNKKDCEDALAGAVVDLRRKRERDAKEGALPSKPP